MAARYIGNSPASELTPEVKFSRSLSRGGFMKKSRFTDSQIESPRVS
jgi:hypothetical protein